MISKFYEEYEGGRYFETKADVCAFAEAYALHCAEKAAFGSDRAKLVTDLAEKLEEICEEWNGREYLGFNQEAAEFLIREAFGKLSTMQSLCSHSREVPTDTCPKCGKWLMEIHLASLHLSNIRTAVQFAIEQAAIVADEEEKFCRDRMPDELMRFGISVAQDIARGIRRLEFKDGSKVDKKPEGGRQENCTVWPVPRL